MKNRDTAPWKDQRAALNAVIDAWEERIISEERDRCIQIVTECPDDPQMRQIIISRIKLGYWP